MMLMGWMVVDSVEGCHGPVFLRPTPFSIRCGGTQTGMETGTATLAKHTLKTQHDLLLSSAWIRHIQGQLTHKGD